KGKKMPGQCGNEKKTVKNLTVVKVDAENGLLAIYGAVP
ncbi:50S ribosomal protein L3, partial [Mesotoga sp. SC_NapDC2]